MRLLQLDCCARLVDDLTTIHEGNENAKIMTTLDGYKHWQEVDTRYMILLWFFVMYLA